jgi:hypothetical protein
VVNKVLSSNKASISVAAVGSFVIGQPITVSISDAVFDGTHVISEITYDSVNARYDISYKKTNANVSSAAVTSGTVTGAAGISYDTTASDILEAQATTGTITTTSAEMQLLINSLESYLSDKKLIGSVVYGEPVEWTNVNVKMNVQVRPLYNRESVRAAVQAAIENIFAYDNVSFGKRISIGDVYRAALAVEGVDYITLDTLKITGETGPIEDIETPSYNLPRIDPDIDTIHTTGWVIASGGLVNT